MDMLEFLRTRRTYRRFEQRPVAPEILTEAVDAARIASCGANRQTVRYIVVQSADAVAAVQPLVHWAAYLPPEQGQPKPDELPTAFIAVLQDDNLPGASDVDVGLALGSLTAAAWAHGVGSCIMGAIDRPALTKLLALPMACACATWSHWATRRTRASWSKCRTAASSIISMKTAATACRSAAWTRCC